MDRTQDAIDVSSRIDTMVDESLESDDFSELAQGIQKEMENYRTFGQKEQSLQMKNGKLFVQRHGDWQRREAGEQRQSAGNRQTVQAGAVPFLQKKPRKIKGILQLVFGIFNIMVGAEMIADPSDRIVGVIWTAGFAYMLYRGIVNLMAYRNFNQYAAYVGNSDRIVLSDLAGFMNKPEERVKKDLLRMIGMNMLPQARFDKEQRVLFLTEEGYRNYQKNRKSGAAGAQSERQSGGQQDRQPTEESRRVVKEGQAFVAEIRKANDAIPGEEMSGKLDQLENNLRRIFSQVENDPASAPSLRKFMNYYLPATRKLLNAYVKLDSQGAGGSASETKRDIESAVDAVNGACSVLLDQMLEDLTMDVQSDIDVMKNMLERDGLAGQEMAGPFGNEEHPDNQ